MGTKLIKFCQNCGSSIETGMSRYCQNCGVEIGKIESPKPPRDWSGVKDFFGMWLILTTFSTAIIWLIIFWVMGFYNPLWYAEWLGAIGSFWFLLLSGIGLLKEREFLF